MRGRKPVPTVLADLHGRPTKTKAPPNEPKAVTGDLAEAPDWMSVDQRAGWQYAITHAPPGLLKRIDRGALTVWIAAEDLHRRALVAQATMPLLVKAPVSGVAMQSPYLPIINRQGQIMLKAASELGFSPVSRPRVGMLAPLPAMKTEGANGSIPTAPRRSLEAFLDGHPATKH